jgi:peptidoglycan/LPS O-acetylase OafA/YrhL
MTSEARALRRHAQFAAESASDILAEIKSRREDAVLASDDSSFSVRTRYRSLDALRGLAALSVLFFHTTWPNHFTATPFARNCYTAVDLFFLLSGFVIAASYATRLDSKQDLSAFIVRRFFRVYPLHAGVLAFLMALECVKFIMQTRDVQSSFASHGAFAGPNSISLLLANLFFLQGTGLFRETSWNAPAWSVSSEFVAYLLFAVAAYFGLIRNAFFLIACAGSGLIGYGALALHFGTLDLAADFGILRCLAGFPIGVAMFQLCARERLAILRRTRGLTATLLEGMALLAVALALSMARGAAIFLTVPAFIALVLLFQAERGFFSRVSNHAALQWLGAISYSVYLVHLPLRNILIKAAQFFGAPSLPSGGERVLLDIPPLAGDALLAIFVVATLTVANLTFRAIEQPGRRLGGRFSPSEQSCSTRRPCGAGASS